MAKRSNNRLDSIISTLETVVDEVEIRSLWPAHVKCTGNVTGRVYDFPSAGSTVKVDRRDVSVMLTRKGGGSCCGGKPSPMFELVSW